MGDREILTREINELPDFLIKQLIDIIHYIKLGIDTESKSKPVTENEFFNSHEFDNVVSEVITEYKKREQ